MILSLGLSETRSAKSQDYRDVIGSKSSVFKCFLSTLKRKAGVFKCLRRSVDVASVASFVD